MSNAHLKCPRCGESADGLFSPGRGDTDGHCDSCGWPRPCGIPRVDNAEAKKNDGDKLRYDLIPTYALARLAEVYTIGAKKYDDNNWRKGFKYSRIIGAMMRHIEAFRRGESVDPDDGQHPLASVAWCAFTLMEFERTHPELDDRVIERDKEQLCALFDICPLFSKLEPCPEELESCSEESGSDLCTS